MTPAALPLRRNAVSRFAVHRQASIGLGLAGAIVTAWLMVHIAGVFLLPLDGFGWLLAPVVVGLQCWLSVGLFIVSHDAMHGSLAPFRPRLNRAVGRVVLLLYGGIWYDTLVARHFAHHRAAGTGGDPDFHGDGSTRFWPWFGAFMREYVSLGQLARQTGLAALYLFAFHAAPANLLIFWACPALLSALQLFYFGTYLPHRREEAEFADAHRARSNDFSPLLSLASCFHFGYHHEHHTDPSVPWWRLPASRKAVREGAAMPDRAG